MDTEHVNTQFAGLVERNWLPIEAQALEATAYETTPLPADKRACDCDDCRKDAVTVSADSATDALQAAYDALWGDRALASAGVQWGKHRKPRKRLWLPVIAYLRGDIRHGA